MAVPRTKALLNICFVVLATGCALIMPLEPIRVEEAQPCQGTACTASKMMDAGGDVTDAKAPSLDAGPRADASMPMMSCAVPPGAECDPVAQCGCGEKESCGLDPQGKQVKCLPRSTGMRSEGDRCTDSSECSTGLACTTHRICAPYCAQDEDCHGSGKCIPALDLNTKNPIPGSGACSRWCDPFAPDKTCHSGSSCYATGAETDDPHATCRYFYSSMTKARGKACDYYNDCDAPLSCAQFGPSVCTSWCKVDSDCPSDMPHCYLDFRTQLVISPGEPIGQCVVWPCEDAKLPPPQPWAAGPVWNVSQYVACTNLCGPSRDCYRTNCMDGERWGLCLDQMLESCAGAVGAPCRKQYVALACSDIEGRTPLTNDFRDCALAQPECVRAAEQACAEQP